VWPMATTDLRAEDDLRELLAAAPLIDGHNDLLWELRDQARYDFGRLDLAGPVPSLQTDLPRLRRGGVGGQFWSVFVPSDLPGHAAVTATLEQLDGWHRMVERYADVLQPAYGVADVERAVAAGRIASLAGMEGGQSIGCSLGALRMLYALGARYLTLTHNDNTPWADSATDQPEHDGLTRFGAEVVRELNRLGMLVDLSHVAPATMHRALDATEAPVIFSHSSARAVCDHPRNVPDDVLVRMAQAGGVCMVTFVPGFVSPEVAGLWLEALEHRRRWKQQDPERGDLLQRMDDWLAAQDAPPATLEQVADHVDHIREVAGVDHIGIGSDFDGVTPLPVGLEDVSRYPALFAELRRRGYSDDELRRIAGRNVLRVFADVEQVAARLRAGRDPSLATLEELDG
jgi:membrane dipeptidase